MERINSIHENIAVGSYAVFSSRDGRRCVAFREDFGVIKFFNDFDHTWSRPNRSGVFTEYKLERRASCFSDAIKISQVISWLNMRYNGLWSICDEVIHTEVETDVKQKKH